jgi:hypothetical protein
MSIHDKIRRHAFPLLAALLLPAVLAHAGDQASREYLVKAVFIRNFAQFVQWPANTFPTESSPVVIGVLGTDPFDGALELAVKDKKADGHPIVVKRFPALEDLGPCNVLFVAASQSFAAVKAKVGAAPVLLVGDAANFTADGGMIRLLLEDDTVRFEVNLDATTQANLKLSSRLLRLAKIYKG